MTENLEELIIRQIQAVGPIALADYMATCLTHPTLGYYATRDPLGAAGDFTTAPEISQMFGELLGLAMAQAWLDRGAPKAITLAELGPGRGTLMADALRATTQVPGFHAAIDLHLVETSPVLRRRQSKTIGHPLTHHVHLGTVPEGPLFLIANEFFDALPVRQFQRLGPAWRERLAGLDNTGRIAPGLSDLMHPEPLDHRLADTIDGDIVEVSAASQSILGDIGHRIAAFDGLAVVIDYGGWRSLGDTFQALRNHKSVSPFEAPGDADLTAHVDFEALSLAAQNAGAEVSEMVSQGTLLQRLGVEQRAQALAKNLSGERLASHMSAYHRLTGPDEMGTLFKALALTKPGSPPPPGFSP